MRIYSIMWLLAALIFVVAGIALILRASWWAPLMLGGVLLSLVLCSLDWGVAFRGALVDLFLLLVLGVVFGLHVQPAPFAAYTGQPGQVTTISLPKDLPQPVERFYRQTYGENIPVYEAAVLSGRGSIRFMGITFPPRVRFSHLAGQGYRHYMETTFYGFPIMKVNEWFLDGHSRLELPFGVVENDPKVDSAANQGLWGEMSAYPAVFLTDPRARWEALDEQHARLFVPFGDDEQEFTISFDPKTGAMTRMETLRYRDEKLGMLRWWGEMSQAKGSPPMLMKVTWEDEGTPWLVVNLKEMVFNPTIDEYIRQRGP